MGKRIKNKAHKVCHVHKRKVCKYRPSLVLGLLFDLWFMLRLVAHVGAMPVRYTAHQLNKVARLHPRLRHVHAHAMLCVFIGCTLVAISFAVEHLFHGALWTCALETTRAAGVCPVWDVVSGVTHVADEFA